MTSQDITLAEALRPIREAARKLREVYTPGPFGDSLKAEEDSAE